MGVCLRQRQRQGDTETGTEETAFGGRGVCRTASKYELGGFLLSGDCVILSVTVRGDRACVVWGGPGGRGGVAGGVLEGGSGRPWWSLWGRGGEGRGEGRKPPLGWAVRDAGGTSRCLWLGEGLGEER